MIANGGSRMAVKLLNYDQAIDYTLKIDDPTTRSLVSFLLRKLELQGLAGLSPESDFDLLYFVKVAESALSCHSRIRKVLDGESLEWPE
jgi:hypothetical protein